MPPKNGRRKAAAKGRRRGKPSSRLEGECVGMLQREPCEPLSDREFWGWQLVIQLISFPLELLEAEFFPTIFDVRTMSFAMMCFLILCRLIVTGTVAICFMYLYYFFDGGERFARLHTRIDQLRGDTGTGPRRAEIVAGLNHGDTHPTSAQSLATVHNSSTPTELPLRTPRTEDHPLLEHDHQNHHRSTHYTSTTSPIIAYEEPLKQIAAKEERGALLLSAFQPHCPEDTRMERLSLCAAETRQRYASVGLQLRPNPCITEDAYRGGVFVAISRLLSELDTWQQCRAVDPQTILNVARPQLAPLQPLFPDPASIISDLPRIIPLLVSLPTFFASYLDPPYRIPYDQTHIAMILERAKIVLQVVAEELRNPGSGGDWTRINSEKVIAEDNAVLGVHLHNSFQHMFKLGVEPQRVSEGLLAVAVYTIELDPAPGIATGPAKLFGSNASLYAVMNWTCRMLCSSKHTWTPTEEATLLDTVSMFAPLLIRIDTFLCQLPVKRRTLYRGIHATLNSSEVKPGVPLVWGQFMSTAETLEAIEDFGPTKLIVHAVSTSIISFVSSSPHERECLLPSFSVFRGMGKMSPTLLSLIGCSHDIVRIRELGDNNATPQELIESLLEVVNHTNKIFSKFLARYDEGWLGTCEPPLPFGESPTSVFQTISDFVRGAPSSGKRHLFLLGTSGCGKTSALIAAHCQLVHTNLFVDGKPVISVFLPLALLENPLNGQELDRCVAQQLGLDLHEALMLLPHIVLVVMLDSLDEARLHAKDLLEKSLLDETRLCSAAHCIVSCRVEFLHPLAQSVVEALTKRNASLCAARYVQPVADTSSFVSRFCDNDEQFRLRFDTLQVEPELLRLQLPLRMACEVAWTNTLPAPHRAGHFPFIQGRRVWLYQLFLWKRYSAVHELGDVENTEYERWLMLQETLAQYMLNHNEWALPISKIHSVVREMGVDWEQQALPWLKRSVPCRIQSFDEESSQFSFYHKSIAEYFVARSFWRDPVQALQATSATAFSLHQPAILRMFNDMCRSDADRRAIVCGGLLLHHIQTNGRGGVGRPSVSNAMALVACSDYPLTHSDLSGIIAEDCELRGANLSRADLRTSKFLRCNLSDCDFSYAKVSKLLVRDCTHSVHVSFKGHTDRVQCVCTSLDGKYVISGSDDKTVRLWEAASGREVRKLEGHTSDVNSVCTSPDGKYVISGSWDTVRVWEIASGREVRKIEVPSGVTSVCTSVYWFIAGSADNTVRLWETACVRKSRKLEGHNLRVNCVCTSPDEKYVISGSDDKTLRMWEAISGNEVCKLEGHTACVTSVCCSPDGTYIISSSRDRTVRVWGAESGCQVSKLEGHSTAVTSVCTSPDGKYIISGSSCKTVLWESASGREVRKLEDTSAMYKVCTSPDGKLIFGCNLNGSLQVWNTSGGGIHEREGHTSYVNSVCASPDGKYVISGSSDRTVRLWEATSGREVRKLDGHTLSVNSVCVSPDGKYVISGSDDKTVRVWEIASGREAHNLRGHTSWVRSVCVSPDGKYLFSYSADSLRIWEAASGREVHNLGSKLKMCEFGSGLCTSPDSKYVISYFGMWETASGRKLWKVNWHDRWTSMCTSPDGRYVIVGSEQRTVKVLEFPFGPNVHILEGHTECVTSVCTSPDGKYIISGSKDNTVRVWKTSSGREVRKLEGHVAVSRYGEYNSTRGSGVTSVSASPNGKFVVSGGNDGYVRVWWTVCDPVVSMNSSSSTTALKELLECARRCTVGGIRGRRTVVGDFVVSIEESVPGNVVWKSTRPKICALGSSNRGVQLHGLVGGVELAAGTDATFLATVPPPVVPTSSCFVRL